MLRLNLVTEFLSMMVLRLRNKVLAMFIATFGVILAYSGPANAIATYSASSSAAVTITGFSTISGPVPKPPTLTIIGTADPSLTESGTTVSGTGTATISEITDVISLTPSAMIAGDSVSHVATASGGATGPGGQSYADQVTNGEIFFGNAGTEDITVTLGIDWAYAVMASTSGLNRKAQAFASIIVDTLIFDSIGEQVGADVIHVDELAVADGIGGSFEDLSDTATLSVDVVVLAGSVTSVGLFVDARGSAEVSAPSSVMIFSLAVFVIGFARRHLAKTAAV